MPTTIKAALKKWEEASGKKSSEAKEIKLIGVYPPIEKMEGPLHILVNCEKLSLSTNLIVTIQNLQVLKNLKVELCFVKRYMINFSLYLCSSILHS